MRRPVQGIAGAAVACAIAVTPLTAQQGITLFAGGGAQIPVGDYRNGASESYKDGYQAMAGVEFPLRGKTGLRLRIDGSYGRNGSAIEEDERTNLYAGSAMVVHYYRAASIHPYIMGGGGLINRQYWDPAKLPQNSFQLTLNAGMGVAVGPPAFQAFGEVRFVYGLYDHGGTPFIPIVGGLRVAFRAH